MEIKFTVPFRCSETLRPHLEKIFNGGEYDVSIGIPQGSLIIDLGANFGAFSVWASHRWPGCEILCFEPNPKVFDVLKQNLKSYPNVKPHKWGIGRPGWRVLRNGPNNEGECSFHEMLNNTTETGQHCEVRDPATLPPCNIMKLDIEACEIEVLEPYIAAGKKPEIIMLEYHAEAIRRKIDEILQDYTLIGAEVQHPVGRGVLKYLRDDIHKESYL